MRIVIKNELIKTGNHLRYNVLVTFTNFSFVLTFSPLPCLPCSPPLTTTPRGREEYSRQLQEYLNQTRHLEIQLRNHLRERYGPPPPPGRRQTLSHHTTMPTTTTTATASNNNNQNNNTRDENVGMWW